jgi:iron complex outermembrane receptor protein
MREVQYEGQAGKRDAGVKKVHIDSDDIKQNASFNLADLLAKQNIFIKNYGENLATISFRGTSTSHTKLYWNDMPLNSPMLGLVDYNLVPVFLLDDVEVNYGGASLTQGSGGFGGSISLTSDSRAKHNAIIDAYQSVGSFGLYRSYLGLNYGSDRFWGSTRVYRQQSANNYPYYNTALPQEPRERLQNADWNQQGIMQTIGGRLGSNTTLQGTSWYQHTYRDIPSPIVVPDNFEHQEDVSWRNSIILKHYTSLALWQAEGNYTNEYLNYKNQLTGLESNSHFNHYMLKAFTKYTLSPKTSLLAGIQSIDDNAYVKDYHQLRRQNVSGAFAEVNSQFTGRLQAGLKVRSEIVDLNRIEPAAIATVSYDVIKNEKLNLHANGGRNYNIPTLNELYWVPGGNPFLKPETSNMLEAGADTRWKWKENKHQLHVSGTFFSNYIYGYILWSPTNSSSIWQPQNLKQVWARGVESSLNYSLQLGKSLFTVVANYTYTRSTSQIPIGPNDNTVGKQLIYVPQNTATARAQWQWKSTTVGLEYEYTDIRYTIDAYLPEYSLIHVSAMQAFRMKYIDAELQLRVNNLANQSYQAVEWRPMPGRWYELGLKLHLKRMK